MSNIYASLTDDDLARLRDELLVAHMQGAGRIRFQDRDVELRSRDDIEGMLRAMNGEIQRRTAPTSGARTYRRIVMLGGGGY